MPRPYTVKWAESEEEVPEWDITRGCPLWAYFDEARQKQTWGPKYVPPTWEVTPAPKTGYPRLVRASFYNYIGGGEQRNGKNYPLLNDLSALHRYAKVGHLKNRVAKLSAIYGEASGEGNTLDEWLKLAARVHLHRRLKRELKVGGLEALGTEWLMTHTALVERQTVDEEETTRCQRLAREMKPVNGLHSIAGTAIISDLNSIEERILTELKTIGSWIETAERSEAKTAKATSNEIRLTIANGLYDHFGIGLYLSPKTVLLQHWGMRVHCRVNVWLTYALSEMWRHDLEVKLCPVCGTLFTPTQGNNKYCEPRGYCAVKASNEKKTKDSKTNSL